MGDLLHRIAALSPAKRELFLLQLKKKEGGIPRSVSSFIQSKAMTVEEMKAEAILDFPIASKAVVNHGQEPLFIFLTGATGFLGAFLLHELLQQTQADIFCLVRASTTDEGKKRIQKNLESYLLWSESTSSRIVPIIGDLSKPLLGLSSEGFQVLSKEIDVIYHVGALNKWTFPYSVLKLPNVLGTREVIRLANQVKVKPIHFISTIGVFSSPTYEPTIVKEQEDLENSGTLYVGIAQSKWIAEKLVTIARSQRLPVCIYRPSDIGCNSKTGVFNIHDHMCLMIKGCVQIGIAPYMDFMVDIAPVDYVSKSIVYLSRRKESLGKTFHLVNPQPIKWTELIKLISSIGYPLQQISYDQWKEKLRSQCKSSRRNALYALSPFFFESILDSAKLPRFDCQNTIEGLADTDIVCPPVDKKLMRTYFSYFKRSGFLDASHLSNKEGH